MSSSLTARTALGTTVPRVIVPVGAFLAGFGPVAVLGFNGGGYAVSVVAGYGVVLWWLLLVGILSGALPRPAPSRFGQVALGAAVLLALWGAISLGWSASSERGLTEVVRLIVFAGSLLLGLVTVAAGHVRHLAGGVLCALVGLVAAGVLSRLQPDLFSGSQDVGIALGLPERLSWPLNYWNGMGALSALTIALALGVAVRSKSTVASALSAASIPLAALCLVMTLSRGGVAAATAGVLAAVLLVAPRLITLRTVVAPAVGSAVLIAAMLQSGPIRDAVGGQAQADAGANLLPLIVLVVLGVALTQAGWQTADRAHWTPRAPRLSPIPTRAAWALAGALAVAIAVGAIASDRGQRAWADFKNPDVTALEEQSGSVSRLAAANGSGRYEEWTGALHAFREHPLGGIGLGSWESWWSPRREFSPAVRNAHSEPLEVAAELGLPGLGLLALIVLAPVSAGLGAAVRRARERPYAPVVTPALAAFVVAISIDWAWQLSALPVAAALLAAAAVGTRRDTAPEASPARGGLRGFATLAAVTVAAVASIGVLAIAMVAPAGVDRSRAAAATGALPKARAEARDASRAAPFSLSAAMQRSLVAERSDDLTAAATAARTATTIEPRNWRPWMVLARIEAKRDRPRAAVAAYRRAKALNPRSRLVAP
jgi:hypothetical protein